MLRLVQFATDSSNNSTNKNLFINRINHISRIDLFAPRILQSVENDPSLATNAPRIHSRQFSYTNLSLKKVEKISTVKKKKPLFIEDNDDFDENEMVAPMLDMPNDDVWSEEVATSISRKDIGKSKSKSSSKSRKAVDDVDDTELNDVVLVKTTKKDHNSKIRSDSVEEEVEIELDDDESEALPPAKPSKTSKQSKLNTKKSSKTPSKKRVSPSPSSRVSKARETPQKEKWTKKDTVSKKNVDFTVETIATGANDPPLIKLTATDAHHNHTWHREITGKEANQLTGGLCDTTDALMILLQDAFNERENAMVRVEREGKEESSPLQVTISQKGRYYKKEFVIRMEKQSQKDMQQLETMVARLVKDLLPESTRQEPENIANKFNVKSVHEDLRVFHNGTAVTHTKAGGWLLASPGIDYTSGKHHWEVRIVHTNSQCNVMVGVVDHLDSLTNYPGQGPHPKGKAIMGSNGFLFQDNTFNDYGIGKFGGGDYVGLTLDMDARTVTFAINGIEGQAKPLDSRAYFFVVALGSRGDSVEIVPNFCHHTN